MSSNCFEKHKHIRTRREIVRLQHSGRKLHSKHFIIILEKNQLEHFRLAITVSTRVDKRAVARNRVKRLIRELFRNHQKSLPAGFDILVIARKDAPSLSFLETRRQLLGTLSHHGFLKKNSSS
ncbi:MAG: ribonuclease P protein component [Bdellovibrionales bacterium]|nr:ribonuclease P protein component [Bdellovibrionales bacterium]